MADDEGPHRWTVRIARHQAALDQDLIDLVTRADPGHVVVAVRSREMQERVRRLVPFPTEVVRLADLLGAVGPAAITEEDLVPDEVVRWCVRDALPPHYKGPWREHVAAEYHRAIRLLAQNGIRPPYPGRSTDPAEEELEATHARLLEALRVHNDKGRYADFQRVLVAAQGPSRFQARHPSARAVVLFGIEWSSPAEELAIERALAGSADLHVLVVGRPPHARRQRTKNLERDWAALAHTDRVVAWADHNRTEALLDLGADADTDAGPDDATDMGHASATEHAAPARHGLLDALFTLRPVVPRPLPDVFLHRPADPDEEVRWTAARIRDAIDNGVAPEEIAIVSPRLERYSERLQDALRAHHIPHTIRHDGRLAATPVGTLLSLLLTSLESGHERDRLLELAMHPLLHHEHVPPGGGRRAWLDPRWLQRTLARRGFRPRGRAGWVRTFERLAASHGDVVGGPTPAPRDAEPVEGPAAAPAEEHDPSDADRDAAHWLLAQRDALLDLLDRLDRLAAQPDAEAFLEDLRNFLAERGLPRAIQRAMRSIEDPQGLAATFRALLALLDDTQQAFLLHGRRATASAARETLARRLAEATVPVAADRSHGVQVLGLRNAAGLVFHEVHLLGALRGDLPARPRQERLLRILHDRFGRRLRRIDPDAEARRIFYALLADTAGPVHLSAPMTTDGDPRSPSILLEELQDVALLPTGTIPAPRVRTTADLHRTAAQTGATWAHAPAHLDAARRLVAARVDPGDVGPYTGHLHDPEVRAAVAAFTLSGRDAVSASRINRAARCGHRSLWHDIARLRADEERDEGLTPVDRGNILHEILDRWTRDLMQRRGTPAVIPDPDHEAPHLFRHAVDVLDSLQFEGIAWTAFHEEILGALHTGHPYASSPPGILHRFLHDPRRAGHDALASEAAFGPDETPVTLDIDGRTLRLRGRIDRIDRVDGGLHVLDFKTGEPPGKRLVLGGVDLQLPLYVHAARVLYPDEEVRGAGYYRLRRARPEGTGPGTGFTVARDATEFDGLVDVETPRRLRALVDAESRGHHPLTVLAATEAGCTYCDARTMCGRRPHHLARRRAAALRLGAGWGYVPDHATTGPKTDDTEGA